MIKKLLIIAIVIFGLSSYAQNKLRLKHLLNEVSSKSKAV